MWIEGNYRRNLMDMHIDDWNDEFLSKIDGKGAAAHRACLLSDEGRKDA